MKKDRKASAEFWGLAFFVLTIFGSILGLVLPLILIAKLVES